MSKVKIDIEVLASTVRTLNTCYDNFSRVYNNLNTSISTLKDSGWDTDAGREFFSNYDESWKQDMVLFLAMISELRSVLDYAWEKYSCMVPLYNSLDNTVSYEEYRIINGY